MNLCSSSVVSQDGTKRRLCKLLAPLLSSATNLKQQDALHPIRIEIPPGSPNSDKPPLALWAEQG